jgi:hypothetical protein
MRAGDEKDSEKEMPSMHVRILKRPGSERHVTRDVSSATRIAARL